MFLQGLHIVDFGMTGYIKEIEVAMAAGEPVLIQNVLETLDPAIRPVLKRSIVQTESGNIYRSGGKLKLFHLTFWRKYFQI